MGLGSCAILEGGCEKSRRAYPPPLAVEIVRVCLCISMDLCYRPAGNILQLLISPGAENEGYRAFFSLLQCFLHLTLFICGCPNPVQAAFHILFYLPKNTWHTAPGGSFLQSGATTDARRDGPRSETRSDKADTKQELTAWCAGGRGKKSWVNPSDSQGQGNPLLKLGERKV